MPNWRQSREVPLTRILYPDYFSLLLKFQIFPLLENGDGDSSPVVLAQLTGERGLEFERNVYEYLKSKEIESYHSCKTSKQNGNEVDIIFAYEDTIYFVEVKFVLPTLNMQSQTGIRDVDRTFDEKIFREDKEGKSFPEKVDAWLSLDPDADITHQQAKTGLNELKNHSNKTGTCSRPRCSSSLILSHHTSRRTGCAFSLI